MKLSEHIRVAKRLLKIHHNLEKMLKFRVLYAPETDLILKTIKELELARSPLDDDFHRITSASQFNKLGHIYYNPREKEKNEKSIVH